MDKFLLLTAIFTIALAAPGFVEEHHVLQPVLAKVGATVHSAPASVSHQSFIRVHNTAVIQPVVAPVVKTTLHAAPVLHSVVKTVATPVVHTFAAPAVVKAVPVVKTIHEAPIVPLVKTIHAVPVVHHAVSHQSHVQLHQKAFVTPVIKSVVPVVHAAPLVKTVFAAPVAHVVHH